MAKEPKAVTIQNCKALRGTFAVEFAHIKDDLDENKADNKQIKKDVLNLIDYILEMISKIH